MSTVRRIDLRGELEPDLKPVVEHLRAGGVLAYPTETVYGLGGLCSDSAVEAVRVLKAREAQKPLIALVGSRAEVAGLAWSSKAADLAEIFWPGAVTLVLSDPDGIFPVGVRSAATGTVGVRVSPHPLVVRLLEALDAPLTSTSLNLPGEPPAVSGDEAAEVLRAMGGEEIMLLDVGTLPESGPSTVVDCSGAEPVVLREGSVPMGRLRCAIPEIHGSQSK